MVSICFVPVSVLELVEHKPGRTVPDASEDRGGSTGAGTGAWENRWN